MRKGAPPSTVCMHVLGRYREDVRVQRAAETLAGAGVAVTVVDLEWEGDAAAGAARDGVRVTHVAARGWHRSRRFRPWFLVSMAWLFVRSVLRLARVRADAYHAHDTKALPACFLAARLRGAALVFDSHELPLASEAEVPHWRGLIWLTTAMLRVVVPRCAAVVTVSPPIAREIRERYGGPAVTLIRNVPPYRAVARTDRLRQHLHLPPATRIALYQGALAEDRGLDRLVGAARFLTGDVVIVLMGPDTEGQACLLEDQAVRQGVVRRVRIIPPVPYGELLEWTASADLGLLVYAPERSPNIRMCLPNKLFEYLVAGLPVLASPLDAVAEIVESHRVGLVVPSPEPADVAAAIDRLLSDPARCADMRRHALDVARRELNWERERQRLLDLYRDLR